LYWVRLQIKFEIMIWNHFVIFEFHFKSSTRCSQRRQTSSQLPPPGELDETYPSFFYIGLLCENMTSSTKPEIHKLEEDRATAAATGNMYRKFLDRKFRETFFSNSLWVNRDVVVTYLYWKMQLSVQSK